MLCVPQRHWPVRQFGPVRAIIVLSVIDQHQERMGRKQNESIDILPAKCRFARRD
jgi:hypothetical protein